jgi:bacterial/archaeal transporter family protein
MTWYTLAIISTFLYGMQNLVFKVAAHRKYNTAWTTFAFFATSGMLGLIFLIARGDWSVFSWHVVILSLISGAVFMITTIVKAEGFKHIQINIFYPITRFKVALVVPLSLILFDEKLNVLQVVGIILTLCAAAVIIKDGKTNKHITNMPEDSNMALGIALAIISVVVGAIGYVILKVVAVEVDDFAYIVIAYSLNTILAFLFRHKLHFDNTNPHHAGAMKLGVLIGVLNFVGLLALLAALKTGPLSIVGTIQSMMFVIVLVLATIIYKEKWTTYRALAVALTVVAVVLMR